MVYRFDRDYNGSVDAEIVDPRASDDLFRGLHFPASDIPSQARDLYKINKIRLLYDLDQETARLLCRDDSDFTRPLDLTHCYLRAMSPIHLKYLANMEVRSSMSISLITNDKLWGLVACHSYGDLGVQVPLPTRELCRNIGECASINLERLMVIRQLRNRKPLTENRLSKNPSGFIATSSADLLDIFDADFGLLSIQNEARAIGRLNPYGEALALLTHVQRHNSSVILPSQNVNRDFPNLVYKPGVKTIAGILIIPLSLSGNDFIIIFRKGQLKEVSWVGNPYEKVIKSGSISYLEPRSSFICWTERVVGSCRDWTEDQVETASKLSLLYGRFIEVWRQKELSIQNSRLTRLLLQNSSHEVRTPLNAIINYIELALENKLDRETKDMLKNAHRASKSMIYVIDDLLNLTKVEAGQVALPSETFGLSLTITEVVKTFEREALRKSVLPSKSISPGLPQTVYGDALRLQQVLSNLMSNAFKYCNHGEISLIINTAAIEDKRSVVEITVQDSGVGMSESQLDDLFQEFEEILDEEQPKLFNTAPSPQLDTLGLGLAVVARYVRNLNGQIRVRSEVGEGTIFTIELPFNHTSDTPTATSPSLSVVYSQPSAIVASIPHNSASDLYEIAPSPIEGENGLKVRFADSPFQNHVSKDLNPTARPVGPPRISSIDATMWPTHPENSMSSDRASNLSEMTNFSSDPSSYPFPDMRQDNSRDWQEPQLVHLAVLIAEDNPVNAKVLKRRLEKSGHTVYVAVDGQECYDMYVADVQRFDVVLMDLQMPLMDGSESARAIRHLERRLTKGGSKRQRIPICAVSASMTEDMRFDYIEDGFDAWIMKPISYPRLEDLLCGIYRADYRRVAVYVPGTFEKGGWFTN